ncbi:MAG: OmpA family protein [Bdellovibrionales bacterium]
MKAYQYQGLTRVNLNQLLLCLAVSVALGCSSRPKMVELPSNSNPNDEIASLDNDIRYSVQNQEDILAPNNLREAKEYLKKAKEQREDNENGQKILESLGIGRAYLNLANADSEEVRGAVPEVVQARLLALKSDAATTQPQRLAEIDKKMREQSLEYESNKRGSISQEMRIELQKDYLDLELRSIKSKFLSGSRSQIDAARKSNAENLSPLTLTDAEMKLVTAEKVIESDRHNERAIRQASLDAERSAQKLSSVLFSAKIAKNKGPEAVAMALEEEKERAQFNRNEANQAQDQLTESERQVLAQKRRLDLNKTETVSLENENNFNQSFESARKEFDPNEAEVYRQGDNLIIRIKSMNFKPGQSSLETRSFETLSKVQNVIGQMDAVKVRVEGHTDSIGNKQSNLKLSQKRAETVANYLISQRAIDPQYVEATGYGYDKPLSTNKTGSGRAQNRRVDIIVTSLKQ